MSDCPDVSGTCLFSQAFLVRPEWIDIYGHMNAGSYFSVFIDQGYELLGRLGLGPAYTASHNRGVFVAEGRIRFLHELKVDTSVQLCMRVQDIDGCKLKVLMELSDNLRPTAAATLEQLYIHVDLSTRKSTAFPEELRTRISSMAQARGQFASTDNARKN